MKMTRVLVVLMLAASLWAQKETKSAAAVRQEQLAQAEAAIDHEQWPQAETILRALTKANAKDAQAWFDLGYVMHAEKNYAEAIAAYGAAAAAQPESFECNLNWGLMLAHEHKADAAEVLEKATRLKPTSDHPKPALARAWAALAEVKASDTKAAVAAWAKAVELDATVENLLGYGEVLEKSGDVASAEAQLKRAVEMDAQSADAQALLANLYMRTHRLAEAEAALRKVVAAWPQNENAHLQLGRVLSTEKKDEEAAAELQKALALKSDDWEAVREIAFLAERNKQWPEAEKQYRALVAHAPNDAEAHNGLGVSLAGQRKYAEARDEFLRCIKLKPEWGESYGQLALAASGNGEYELAIKALDERKKRLAETPSSYFLRATCNDHLRRYAEAVENYKAFLGVANGQYPDDEWKARHRLIAIEPEAKRKK